MQTSVPLAQRDSGESSVAAHAVGADPAPGLDELAELVAGGAVVVLSGAGLSTESGIPDYRGPTGAARPATPMTYQVFTGEASARRRYWARSHVGWQVIDRARPNAGHEAVSTLEHAGLVRAVITQNVDGLHDAAGGREVVELHGNLDRVVCLSCGTCSARSRLQARLSAANRAFSASALAINPDGDVELAEADLQRFRVVDCERCGGVLKPDVVFFGETVPADRVRRSFDLVDGARLLLVLGSSLTVMSGHRFVLRASRAGTPVVIVNQGATRGDPYARLKLESPLGATLGRLVARLGLPAG